MKKNIKLGVVSLLIVATLTFAFFMPIISDNVQKCFKIGQYSNIQQNPITLKDVSTFKQKISGTTDSHLPPDFSRGYGIRLYDNDGNFVESQKITCLGKPMRCFLSLTNANPYKEKMSFMMFIDDKLQPFSVDGNKEVLYSYIQSYPEYSLINIPITFTPVLGKKGETHYIWFAFTCMLDKKPNGKNHIPFFLNTLRRNIVFSDDSSNSIDAYKPVDLSRAIPVRKDILPDQGFKLAINIDKKIKNIYQVTRLKIKKTKSSTFRIEAVADKGTYTTYVFLDHKTIKINGDDYITWSASKKQMLSQKFTFNVPDKIGEYQMYTITIPLKPTQERLFESEKFMLEVTE